MNLRRPAITNIGVMSVCALLSLAVGCDDSNDTARSNSSASIPAATSGTPSATPVDGTAVLNDEIDACALITDAEIADHLPGAGGGTSAGPSSCEWRDPATEESITLTIGDAGTAASGNLREPSDYDDAEPVPEMVVAARFSPTFGIVEFVAGDRLCEIQVAVNVDPRAPAVALATLARDRILG